MLRTVGGGVWKARIVLSAPLREPKNMLGGWEGLEDPSDCLGPDGMAKNCLGRWAVGSGSPELSCPIPLREPPKNCWGGVVGGLEEPNDCLCPDDCLSPDVWAKKHLLGKVGGGVWKARIILSVPLREPKK